MIWLFIIGEHDLFVDLSHQDLSIEKSLPLNQCKLWTWTNFLLNIFDRLIFKEHYISTSNKTLLFIWSYNLYPNSSFANPRYIHSLALASSFFLSSFGMWTKPLHSNTFKWLKDVFFLYHTSSKIFPSRGLEVIKFIRLIVVFIVSPKITWGG